MSNPELASHLLALATLRLLTCSPEGRFTHVRSFPLHVLSQLTTRYLQLLGGTAKQIAEQGGRTSANARDVVQAIEAFGTRLDELWDWCEDRRLGGEGVQMALTGPVEPATLGALLKGNADGTQQKPVSQVIEYRPLTQQEESEAFTILRTPAAQLEQQPSSPLSAATPPPTYEEAVYQESPHDASTSLLTKDIMSFLPPLPDLSATLEAVQTIEEDESGRTVKRARRALEGSTARASGASASWHRSIPYEGSALAEFAGVGGSSKALPNVGTSDAISGLLLPSDGQPLSSSSLLYFLETFGYIAQDAHLSGGPGALPLRANAKRRRAATAIHSNILNPSDDSLGGAIPTPHPRHAKKQAGWIPFPPLLDRDDPHDPSGKAVQQFPQLHPFSTSLPVSMTESVPTAQLPHSSKNYAPIQHPRIPTSHSSIRTLLELSSNLNTALFNRATRLGPPGPLLENGASGFYAVELEKPNIPGWAGDTPPRMMSWNFDWEIGNELEEPSGSGAGQKSAQTPASASANGIPAPSASVPSTPAASTSSYVAPSFPSLPQRGAGQSGHSRQTSLAGPAGMTGQTPGGSVTITLNTSSSNHATPGNASRNDNSNTVTLARPFEGRRTTEAHLAAAPFAQPGLPGQEVESFDGYFDGFTEVDDSAIAVSAATPAEGASGNKVSLRLDKGKGREAPADSAEMSMLTNGSHENMANGANYPPDPYGQISNIQSEPQFEQAEEEPSRVPAEETNYPPDPYGQGALLADETAPYANAPMQDTSSVVATDAGMPPEPSQAVPVGESVIEPAGLGGIGTDTVLEANPISKGMEMASADVSFADVSQDLEGDAEGDVDADADADAEGAEDAEWDFVDTAVDATA